MRVFLLSLLLLPTLALAAQTQLMLNRDDPKDNTVGLLTFMGAVVIPAGPDKVGGLSSIEMGQSDRHLFFQADDGRFYSARVQWSNSKLIGVNLDKGLLLRDENGRPPTSRARFDSESLSRLPDGDWLVGYERDHRIERYKDIEGRPSGIPIPMPALPGLAELPRNDGLEAMTALPNGNILAIAEAKLGEVSPAWLWQEGHWQKLSYRPKSGFVPVDATSLRDGSVLVLERSLNLLYGFRSRIVHVKAPDIKAGAVLDGTQLALMESPHLSENFEGIHAFAGPDGKTRLFIVSDNNFNAIQQTILAAFELTLP